MSDVDTTIDWDALGRALREQREKAGTPPDVVARQLCLSKHQILALENGVATCFPGVAARYWCAQRYAAQLGISSLDQFSGTPAIAPIAVPRVAPAFPPVEEAEEETADELPQVAPVDGETPRRSGATIGKLAAGFIIVVVLLIVGLFNLNHSPPPDPAPEPIVPAAPPITVEAPPPPSPQSEEVPAPPEPPVVETKKPPPDQVVDVPGINPEKSSRILFVATREPAVLITKRPGKGETSLNLDKGAALRIDLTGDETLRVAEGKDLDLYFQGRKIWSGYIEAGNWMRFVPLRQAPAPAPAQ